MTDPKIVLQDLAQRLRAAFPGKVKEVILHGSHLRGDAREDSDYDFVIVWNGAVTEELRDAIYGVAFETDLALDVLVHPLIIGTNEKDSNRWHLPLFADAFVHGLKAA